MLSNSKLLTLKEQTVFDLLRSVNVITDSFTATNFEFNYLECVGCNEHFHFWGDDHSRMFEILSEQNRDEDSYLSTSFMPIINRHITFIHINN